MRFSKRALLGTTPEKIVASAWEKLASGAASLIVISPVESSVSIPVMSPPASPRSA